MSTIFVKDLENLIKSPAITAVDNDRIDIERADYWTRETENEYNKVTRRLDKVVSKGKGYTIQVWYDISGFDYWVNNMKEENYAQITVYFDTAIFETSRIKALINKIDRVINKVLAIIEN